VRFWSGRGKALGINVQRCGIIIGFSTITTHLLTHHLFNNSRVQKHYSDSSPPICLTSTPANFSYSPRRNYSWKGNALTQLRRSIQNHKTLSTHSHLRTSSNVWNHGIHAGITAYMSKETTSKRWRKLGVTVRNYFFYGQIPWNFR
jgi:hypothetical protein